MDYELFQRMLAGETTRIFGPKRKDHPSVGTKCFVCDKKFKGGGFTALVPVKPASDEDLGKMLAGKSYTAEACEIHKECAIKLGMMIAPDECDA